MHLRTMVGGECAIPHEHFFEVTFPERAGMLVSPEPGLGASRSSWDAMWAGLCLC